MTVREVSRHEYERGPARPGIRKVEGFINGPGAARDDRDDNVRRMMEVARSVLGVETAWVSRFTGGEQVFTHVLSQDPADGPRPGSATRLEDSLCIRVLDGRLAALIPDARSDPVAGDLEITRAMNIGAYAGVPITGPAGDVTGMLCCTSSRPRACFATQDLAPLRFLAAAIGSLLAYDADDTRTQRQTKILDLVAGVGRRHVLQPIVDVRTGAAVGVEALARFEDPPHRPDLWFAEAAAVGLRTQLEIAAARTGLTSLTVQAGYVSINLSPETVIAGALGTLLAGVDATRVVVEITEHDAVSSYEELVAALAPHRALGLRLAIDDAGAGYSSFRHILQLHPDYIKMDISLVRDIHDDPVRQALTASLLACARAGGAELIAEGVEVQAELDTLARLGVTLIQGYLLCRPCDEPPAEGYQGPSRHVVVNGSSDLAAVLADAVRNGHDLERLTRPLLDAVLSITGLETSYLTVLGPDGLEHRFVRNAGGIELPEGFTMPWEDSICSLMSERGLTWTNDQGVMAERPVALQFGLGTFMSTPVRDSTGALLGTVCGGSREHLFISDATVAQLQMIAFVLSSRLKQEATGQPG